ncbi:MAG: glycosyltransferase family 1 protein [Candidatus Pacebacteria bacterium]|nr:glycosyltransferase family 1 protein [Candidatus Paceibacterota bacterium]
MNILIDVRFLGKETMSGVGEYASSLIAELIKSSPEQNFKLLYNGWHKNPPPFLWTERKNVEIIDWNLPNKFFNLSSKIFNWPNIEKIARPNIAFSPHLQSLSLKNTPHVLTIHDLSFLHYPSFFSKSQRLWHFLQNCRAQSKKASHIITDSEFTKSDLIDFFKIPPEKISVVYPGINSSFRFLQTEKEKEDLNKFVKKQNLFNPYLLYLGSFEPRKNISAVIRAFNEVKKEKDFSELELVLAGSKEWLFDEVRREIFSSPFRNFIKIKNNIIPSERVFLYNEAKAFLYPSFFEGFGFPPLEAQSCGIPVIAGNRSSLPEILGDSAILVDPWKISELTFAIKKIMLEKNLSEDLKKRGLENVKKFNWTFSASKILKILSSQI